MFRCGLKCCKGSEKEASTDWTDQKGFLRPSQSPLKTSMMAAVLWAASLGALGSG